MWIIFIGSRNFALCIKIMSNCRRYQSLIPAARAEHLNILNAFLLYVIKYRSYALTKMVRFLGPACKYTIFLKPLTSKKFAKKLFNMVEIFKKHRKSIGGAICNVTHPTNFLGAPWPSTAPHPRKVRGQITGYFCSPVIYAYHTAGTDTRVSV